jgi:hypothetical protein
MIEQKWGLGPTDFAHCARGESAVSGGDKRRAYNYSPPGARAAHLADETGFPVEACERLVEVVNGGHLPRVAARVALELKRATGVHVSHCFAFARTGHVGRRFEGRLRRALVDVVIRLRDEHARECPGDDKDGHECKWCSALGRAGECHRDNGKCEECAVADVEVFVRAAARGGELDATAYALLLGRGLIKPRKAGERRVWLTDVGRATFAALGEVGE